MKLVKSLNEFQTPVTEELLESLPKEVQIEFLEYLDSIAFIRNLTSPTRNRIKDCDKYPDGRVIVNITNPHILENMDFFRERAIYFEKHGCYTHIPPNQHPQSEYAAFWKEEFRRWREGLVRDDGEWISGYYYFYLNYAPIWKVIGTGKKVNRTQGFPDVWLGDYLWYHYIDQAEQEGEHCKLLKARLRGFSYKTGSMGVRNMYAYPGEVNYFLASEKTFLEGDGIFPKITSCLDWLGKNTPVAKLRLIDKPLDVQLGYKDNYGIEMGLKSKITGVSLKDNPNKARGIRAKLIDYEEDGVFPNIESAWNINMSAISAGDSTFGLQIAGGTGGTRGANFEGSEKMFYNPSAYNIYGISNVFDKNSDEGSKCGFFWGEYLNRTGCYNHAGECDITKALIEVLLSRYNIKYNSKDPLALTQRKAETPLTPQDAIMRIDGTIFPVADLREYLEEIYPNRNVMEANHYVGLLKNQDNSVIWEPSSSVNPLRKFPHVDTHIEGALVMFELPKKGAYKGRIIFGVDTIDDDTGTSLGSIIGMDTLTKRIVCEYTGRPKFANEFYELCRRLALFYNGEICYENNKKGLFTYFSNMYSLHLLVDTPSTLRDMNLVKGELYGNKVKGVNATKEINAYARRLIRDWLLSPAYTELAPEEGEHIKTNLRTIQSIPLIEELTQWNPDGNFDRVSALGMTMILLEDKMKYVQAQSRKEDGDTDFLDSDFFKKTRGRVNFRM